MKLKTFAFIPAFLLAWGCSSSTNPAMIDSASEIDSTDDTAPTEILSTDSEILSTDEEDTGDTSDPCVTCHGQPPSSPHPQVTECSSCHGDVIGPDGQFVDPSLHMDGKVQVSGGSCDGCHGFPPAPDNESYTGGAGAHQLHTGALELACTTCHGHDGDSETHHDQSTSVLKENVDLVLGDLEIDFPGGTTIDVDQEASIERNDESVVCQVGCHNPIPGDTANLDNVVAWDAGVLGCNNCHDRPGVSLPWNHDIDGTPEEIRTNCNTCHDTTDHMDGSVLIADPDPSDDFSFQEQGFDGLCLTCHDDGDDTFFGGVTPSNSLPNLSSDNPHWWPGASCATCHFHHGQTSEIAGLNYVNSDTLCLGCHGDYFL